MQQAKCAHSGADTGTSPGNDEIYTAPTRRALLGFTGIGALALALPAAANTLTIQADDVRVWDGAKGAWQKAKEQSDTMSSRSRIARLSGAQASVAENQELSRLCELECATWYDLMETPAPHQAALRWKIEQIVVPDEDGFTASWRADVVEQLLKDTKRLLSDG